RSSSPEPRLYWVTRRFLTKIGRIDSPVIGGNSIPRFAAATAAEMSEKSQKTTPSDRDEDSADWLPNLPRFVVANRTQLCEAVFIYRIRGLSIAFVGERC